VGHMTTNLTDFEEDVEQEMFTDDSIICILGLRFGTSVVCRRLWFKVNISGQGSKA
jgi:hypothetical protein